MARKGGFRRLSYEDGFDVVEEREAALTMLRSAANAEERECWRSKVRKLGNRITPAWLQSSAPFSGMVRSEAKAWVAQHGGMPNVAAFIRHFQSLACATRIRWESGKPVRASDDSIRKILVKADFHRPRPRQPKPRD
jgi:hypothetical protein